MGSQIEVTPALALAETRAILLFASAEILDVATTLLGLRSGRFREANPLAGGPLGANIVMALKLSVVMAILLLVHRFVSPSRRAPALMVMATIALVAPALNVAHILAGG
jgi:hypothetical protein